jgi:hypothetical protein
MIMNELLFPYYVAVQQQHSVKMQLGHSLGEPLLLHFSGEQQQSAHLTFINTTRLAKIKTIPCTNQGLWSYITLLLFRIRGSTNLS